MIVSYPPIIQKAWQVIKNLELNQFYTDPLKLTYFRSSDCSSSKGPIFSRTYEYWTFALVQAANGSAAVEALLAFYNTFSWLSSLVYKETKEQCLHYCT